MILYKKQSFLKEIIYVWFWGTVIMFSIGFIIAIGNILFDFIY